VGQRGPEGGGPDQADVEVEGTALPQPALAVLGQGEGQHPPVVQVQVELAGRLGQGRAVAHGHGEDEDHVVAAAVLPDPGRLPDQLGPGFLADQVGVGEVAGRGDRDHPVVGDLAPGLDQALEPGQELDTGPAPDDIDQLLGPQAPPAEQSQIG